MGNGVNFSIGSRLATGQGSSGSDVMRLIPVGGGTGESMAPPKRYRIGEVIRHTGFSRQTLHNYTVMGLIHESDWTEGGHRLYDEDVFQRLALIRQLKGRYRLTEVKQILDGELTTS